MTLILTIIATISWCRFLWIGFTTRGGLTEQSVHTPLLWTIVVLAHSILLAVSA